MGFSGAWGIGALQTVAVGGAENAVNAFGTYMLCLENDSLENGKCGQLSTFKALYSLVFDRYPPYTEFMMRWSGTGD